MSQSLLDVLLGDTPERVKKPWAWAGKGVQIPCQGLYVDELREIRKKATRLAFNPKTHQREDEFDQDMFNDELILACTPEAPWTDQRVRDHYGVIEAAAAMRKAMRDPDDYSNLLLHCMVLCKLATDEGTPAETPEETVKN